MKQTFISALLLAVFTMTACSLPEVEDGEDCAGNTEGKLRNDAYSKPVNDTINKNMIIESGRCTETFRYCIEDGIEDEDESFCSYCPSGSLYDDGECSEEMPKCSTQEDCQGDDEYCIHGYCVPYQKNTYYCKGNDDCGDGTLICSNKYCIKSDDIPKPCTVDDDCQNSQTCQNKQCQDKQNNTKCSKDADCNTNQKCTDGSCVYNGEKTECIKNADCGNGLVCIDGSCVDNGEKTECIKNADCGNGQVCIDGSCVYSGEKTECIKNADCGDGQVCTDGSCVYSGEETECIKNADCGDGQVCTDGSCVAASSGCTSEQDCNTDEICSNSQCVKVKCKSSAECQPYEMCSNYQCIPDPSKCNSSAGCQPYEVCSNYQCIPDPSKCSSDADCSPIEKCSGWQCVRDGNKCISDSDCESDEYCNSNACTAYHYVMIKDLTTGTRTNGYDYGADIDAVAIVRNGTHIGFANSVVEFHRGDGINESASNIYASVPQKALGDNNSVDGDQCKYFADDSNSINNTECNNSNENGASRACDYNYTFVSLSGGSITLKMASAFKPGDVIRVYKLGDCTLANTASGNPTIALSETIKVSVSADGSSGWVGLGSAAPKKGIVDFKVK